MNVFVIGGGASGLMAAGTAASQGATVTLLEKNEKLGKKLYITGKGRCNFTNALEPKDFLENVVNNRKFLYGAIHNLPPDATIEFLKKYGLSAKIERGGRVFPLSDKASDVTKALTNFINDYKVKVIYNSNVKKISNTNNMFEIVTQDNIYLADKVILACGGASYPMTGSNGDGYRLAKRLGHKLIEPRAALINIELVDDVSAVTGLSLKNVEASILNHHEIKPQFGEMIFTNSGISGPIILSLSSYINRLDFKDLYLLIDLKPALDKTTLEKRLLSDFALYNNKQIKNALFDLLPRSLIPFIINYCKIDNEKFINSITKSERVILLNALKGLTLKIKSLGNLDQAIVTSGGVDVNLINPKTMESKIIPGLYFSGELLDIDALTGGFNIQIALSTGYTAGKFCIG